MGFTVLIVEDEDSFRSTARDYLNLHGYEVVGVATLAEARSYLSKGTGDVVVLDVQLPDGYGPNLLQETAHLPFRPPMILITGVGNIEMAVDAMKNGAHDFLSKPMDLVRLEQSIQRACEIVTMRRELDYLRDTQRQKKAFVTGNSQDMRTVMALAQRAATLSVSVLITGETGTGKEIMAKFIHQSGSRVGKQFIDINCAAMQSTILESELFGYEAGAFTGAERRKHGLMELADGGVLFLDEISSLPLDMQAKLLRAIEERAFRRVGGTTLIRVDVQFLAASNRDLREMIKLGLFREDLYYRLKVLDLHLPPLRDRNTDIPELAGFLLRELAQKMGVNVTNITPQAMEALIRYRWPGNIRELRNVIERAILFSDGGTIDLSHLSPDLIT
jgi:two-component system, NtrC family, response regulator AtoC